MPRGRRWGMAALLLAGLVTGCGKKNVSAAGDFERFTVLVENRGYYDVTIYAVRSPNSTGTRLDRVNGGSSAVLRVRTIDFQAGNRLVLRVRAAGTNATWLSQGLAITPGTVGRLNIYSTANGDLSQTVFYAQTQPQVEPDTLH